MAEIDGGIFPQPPDFINHRQAGLASGTICRPTGQHRGMRVHNVRTFGADHLGDAALQRAHFQRFGRDGSGGKTAARLLRAMEGPAVHGFDRTEPFVVARRGDLHRIPPEPALRGQDAERSEHLPAVQRQGMVKDVKNSSWREDREDSPQRRRGGVIRLCVSAPLRLCGEFFFFPSLTKRPVYRSRTCLSARRDRPAGSSCDRPAAAPDWRAPAPRRNRAAPGRVRPAPPAAG